MTTAKAIGLAGMPVSFALDDRQDRMAQSYSAEIPSLAERRSPRLPPLLVLDSRLTDEDRLRIAAVGPGTMTTILDDEIQVTIEGEVVEVARE